MRTIVKFFPSAYSKGAFKINAPVARSCKRKGYFEPVVDYDAIFAMKDIDDYVKGEQTYQNGYWHSNNNDPYSWVDRRDMEESINRKTNGSFARRVTESVMRKFKRGLTEWRDVSDDLIEFDNAEEALDFVKRHINGNEELFINSESLTFGLGQAYTWEDMAREFLKSPEAENANVKQGKNSAFLHFDDEGTLLAYLRWLENTEGTLYFLTNPDEEGEPRPLENYI